MKTLYSGILDSLVDSLTREYLDNQHAFIRMAAVTAAEASNRHKRELSVVELEKQLADDIQMLEIMWQQLDSFDRVTGDAVNKAKKTAEKYRTEVIRAAS